MVRLTLIARVRDGLPLAEGLDADKEHEMYSYKSQAKVGRGGCCLSAGSLLEQEGALTWRTWWRYAGHLQKACRQHAEAAAAHVNRVRELHLLLPH